MKKRLKINGIIMFIAMLLIIVFPSLFFRLKNVPPLDKFAQVCGIAFILLGQIFRASARGYKSQYSRQGMVLIKGGPYALVRNPMYLGILLIGMGIMLVLFQWWVGVVFVLIFAIRYIMLIFEEEKNLLSNFSREYSDYQKKTPRLIPAPRQTMQTEISDYLPLKRNWLKKEIGSILAILLSTIVIAAGKDIYQEGFSVYLREAAVVALTVILFAFLIIYLISRTESGEKNVSAENKNNL